MLLYKANDLEKFNHAIVKSVERILVRLALSRHSNLADETSESTYKAFTSATTHDSG